MKHNRKFSSINHQFSNPPSNDSSLKHKSDSESQKLLEQYIHQSLKSDAIEDFWQDIEVYTHEPGKKHEYLLQIFSFFLIVT